MRDQDRSKSSRREKDEEAKGKNAEEHKGAPQHMFVLSGHGEVTRRSDWSGLRSGYLRPGGRRGAGRRAAAATGGWISAPSTVPWSQRWAKRIADGA